MTDSVIDTFMFGAINGTDPVPRFVWDHMTESERATIAPERRPRDTFGGPLMTDDERRAVSSLLRTGKASVPPGANVYDAPRVPDGPATTATPTP